MTNIEKSTRYSALVDAKARDAIVLKDGVIFNNRYEGSAKAGAVKVRKSGAATVQDYGTNGAILTTGESEWITVTIDKDKAVNEKIDNFDSAAIPDGKIADRLDAAGYGMALALDEDGAAELVNGGTTLESKTALTKTNVYDTAVDTGKALSKAGIPNDGRRYILVTPDTYALMLKSPEFIKASALGDAVVQTGAIGKIAGFLVFECNHLGTKTVGEGEAAKAYDVEFVAGHPDYATRVNEWAVDIHVQDLSGSGTYIGESAVQGRKIYAHKVTNKNAILVKTVAKA